MARATMRKVDDQMETLNRVVGKERGEIGSFRLDAAYNGYRLGRIVNEHGGMTTLTSGYETLTAMSHIISGVIIGISVGRTEQR